MFWALKNPNEGGPLRQETTKSRLPGLLRGAQSFKVPPTHRFVGGELQWDRVCIKPDFGSGSAGVWFHTKDAASSDLFSKTAETAVVQPYLPGHEFRVTVGASDYRCAAMLLSRRGHWRLWSDATRILSSKIFRELTTITRALNSDLCGFDVIFDGTTWWVIDVNDQPDVAMHTARPHPITLSR